MHPLSVLLSIAVYICAAITVAYLGRRRKWGYWGYLWSSILFTPLIGLLLVLAADPPPKQAPKEALSKDCEGSAR